MAGAPDLTPCSFDVMLDRVAHEWGSQRRVFDLPTARFWSPHPETDLSMNTSGDQLPLQSDLPRGPTARWRRISFWVGWRVHVCSS